ncbi:MAG TPA: biopolymer transporter ExbD [Phaeodactylibacter sp.]|nr:biopolymer transporter ExbD [Phaeodactylibacter sp.]
MKKQRRPFSTEINAGSMADIAFLLLIFFLVVTTIAEDKGILVRLPPWTPGEPPTSEISNRNLLRININAEGLLLVEGVELPIVQLKERSKEFIANPLHLEHLPADPRKAVISIRNDRGTSYQAYLSVYNEIKAAYNEVWREAALSLFQKEYLELSSSQQKEIRKQYPQVISEAEPTSYGVE